MEDVVARNSNMPSVAEKAGTVRYVDSQRSGRRGRVPLTKYRG
jgi:hypothetical protein